MREIVLDTETTGLDPGQGHRIIEIGCLELRNRTPTGAKYHAYINPERDVPEESQRITNLSTEFLRDKPVFADVVDGFLEFIGDSGLVIHNAEFDLKFLNAELGKLKKGSIPSTRAVDTLMIARRRFPGASASLDALCRRFDISLDDRRAKGHGALLDAALLAEVYLELSGGRQPGLELVANAGLSDNRAVIFKPVVPRPSPLPPRISAEELERHAVAIATLGQSAIWFQAEA
ncbi:MAG: DNA polymerase III subunit epsilon [Alphaproteobacteria bacterium]|nr:DNA polymerase III subunit epsilon [Alphaproteobacteria bacterium]